MPQHLQTVPSVIPDGFEPSVPGCRPGVWPLDHEIASVTEAGLEPAKSRDSRPRRFACLRARPRSSSGYRSRTRPSRSTIRRWRIGARPDELWATRIKRQVAGPGNDPVHRPHEGWWAPAHLHRVPPVAKARVELARPDEPSVGARHDLLSVACLPNSTTWPSSVTRTGEGVEPSRLRRSTAFEAAAITHWLALPYIKLRWQESNPRPGPYKRPALTTELHAHEWGRKDLNLHLPD